MVGGGGEWLAGEKNKNGHVGKKNEKKEKRGKRKGGKEKRRENDLFS